MYQSEYEIEARIRSLNERAHDRMHELTRSIASNDGSAGAGKKLMAGLFFRLKAKLSGGRRHPVSNLHNPAPVK